MVRAIVANRYLKSRRKSTNHFLTVIASQHSQSSVLLWVADQMGPKFGKCREMNTLKGQVQDTKVKVKLDLLNPTSPVVSRRYQSFLFPRNDPLDIFV